MRDIEGRSNYVAGMVWNVWAEYFDVQHNQLPPFEFLRIGGGDDLIFASGVSEGQLEGFIEHVKMHPLLKFRKEAQFWLVPWRWFGKWVVFSAQPRQRYNGIRTEVWDSNEAFDFDQIGDSRLKPLYGN